MYMTVAMTTSQPISSEECSDDDDMNGMKWKDFFGSSLDLSPGLLSIYDQYSTKDQNDNNNQHTKLYTNDSIIEHVKNEFERENGTVPNIYQDTTIANNCDNCDKVSPDFESSDKLSSAPETDQSNCDNMADADVQIRTSPLSDNQKRPLSISSMSSASSSSLPNHFRCKRPNLGDFDTSSSGPETGSRSSYGTATDGSSSNMSVDTTGASENDTENTINGDGPIYDTVYEDGTIAYCGSNIYENLPPMDNLTDTNDEEIYANMEFTQRISPSVDDDSDSRTSIPTKRLSMKSSSDRSRSTRNRLFKSPASSPNLSQGHYVSYAQRVAAELVDTEQTYMKSLQEIILGYMHDLNHAVGITVTEQDKSYLFGNLVDIYQFSRELLKELVECKEDPVAVAKCFVTKSKGFSIYASYCTNYPKSMEVLTKYMSDTKIAEVFRLTQACLGHGLALGAYLLKPVQRILKYHLLFQNIVKNNDPSSEGYSTLTEALETMTCLAKDINEMKRKHEHAVRIQEVGSQLEDYVGPDLTTLGELILEGSFRMYGAKASRQTFLFERAILVTKKKDTGMMSCKAFIMCQNLMLVESVPKEPQSFHIIPFNSPKLQCTLVARNIDMKRRWCQEIKKLILASYSDKIPEKAKSLVMELGRGIEEKAGSVNVSEFTDNSSGYKQHTAPGYLEKRIKGRRKSGTFIDFPLLKHRKAANKKTPEQPGKGPVPGANSTPKPTNFNDENMEEFLAMVGSKSMDDISRMRIHNTPNTHPGQRNTIQVTSTMANPFKRGDKSSKSNVNLKSKTFSFNFGRNSDEKPKAMTLGREDKTRKLASNRWRRDSGKASSDVELYESSESSDSETDSEESYVNVVYSRKSDRLAAKRKEVSHKENISPDDDGTDRDSGYVQMTMRTPKDVGSHQPLKRMSYSKSLGSLTKMSKDHVNSLISKHSTSAERLGDKERSPSPIASNSSSYENVNYKWQHNCDEVDSKPDTLPKPPAWKIANSIRRRVQEGQSQSCNHSNRPVSWANNEVTIYEEYQADPWVRNPSRNQSIIPTINVTSHNDEPTHPALRKFSEPNSSYTNQYVVKPSMNFSSTDHKPNFDWIVYKNKLANSKGSLGSLDKLISDSTLSLSSLDNSFGVHKDVKTTRSHSPSQLIDNTADANTRAGSNVEDPVYMAMRRNSAVMSPSFSRRQKTEQITVLQKPDVSAFEYSQSSDSDKLVEEMENYAKTSENNSRSHLPRFPTSPFQSYMKSSGSVTKDQMCNASSRESLKSLESTGSASTVLSSFSLNDSLAVGSPPYSSDGVFSDSGAKLHKFSSTLVGKTFYQEEDDEQLPKVEKDNNYEYGCRVSQLARKYNSRERDSRVESTSPARKLRSGSFLEPDNTRSLLYSKKTRSKSLDSIPLKLLSTQKDDLDDLNKELKGGVQDNKFDLWKIHKYNEKYVTDSDTDMGSSFNADCSCDEIDYNMHPSLELDTSYNSSELNEKTQDFNSSVETNDDEIFYDDESQINPPHTHPKPRGSIKKYVRIIEENNRPRPTCIIDVKKRKTSGTIQERLRHLQLSSQYQQQNRAVVLNGDMPPKSVSSRKAELFLSSRTSPEKIISYKVADKNANVYMKSSQSMGNLDKISNTTSLETMKGWVQQLISKFQSEK